MEELGKEEILIEGKWQLEGNTMHADNSCKRIDWLIENKLKKLAQSNEGWEILYQDPRDLRLWVLTYPKSEMHGGGPPMLTLVSEEEAFEKFIYK